MSRPVKKVALFGVDGSLGPDVLKALVDADFEVTSYKRQSSKSKSSLPPSVREQRVADDFNVENLVEVLQGQDAVVCTISGSQIEPQKRIADACVQVGIMKMIPADFGSVDSASERARDLVPLYGQKLDAGQYLSALSDKHPDFTWTSLVCGHFFDYSLDFLHIYPQEQRADVVDGGHLRNSFSSFAQTGKAIVAILKHSGEELTKNRRLFVQSFCKTQREVIAAFERVTASDWKIQDINGDKFVKENLTKRDQGDKDAVEDLVWWLGAVEANWEGEKNFANKELGLQEENLEDVVRAALKKFT